MDAWSSPPTGKGGGRWQSQKLTLTVAALLLVGVMYVMWNPVAGGTERMAATPLPTAAADSDYFLKAYQDPATPAPAETNGWAVVLDLGLKLLLVVGLIYLSAWGLRAVMGKARLGLARTGRIGVLESATLAPNKALYLVEVGGRVLLLGGTQTQIALLSEFNDPEVVRDLKGERDFSRQLEASAARLENGAAATTTSGLAEGQAFIQERIRELRQISQRFGRKE